MISLLLYIQVSSGNSIIYEDMGEIYWPAMNIEEGHVEVVMESKVERSPAGEVKKYRSIEELEGLVDVCWYRCIFEVKD